MIAVKFVCLCVFWRYSPQWKRASSFTRFLDHTHRRATVGRTPLDECSARRRDLYLTTHTKLATDKHPSPGWDEPTISAGERPHTYASPNGHTASVFGRFLTLPYSADPSVDHALPSVWSYCTRSTTEITPVFNGTSCGVH
jgi:hypothetical protein